MIRQYYFTLCVAVLVFVSIILSPRYCCGSTVQRNGGEWKHKRMHTFNMDTWPCDRKSLENTQTEKWAHNRTSAWRRWFLAEWLYVRERARNSTVILLRPSLQSGRLGVALQTVTSSHHYHFKLIFLLQKRRCIIRDTCGLSLKPLLLLQVSELAS